MNARVIDRVLTLAGIFLGVWLISRLVEQVMDRTSRQVVETTDKTLEAIFHRTEALPDPQDLEPPTHQQVRGLSFFDQTMDDNPIAPWARDTPEDPPQDPFPPFDPETGRPLW